MLLLLGVAVASLVIGFMFRWWGLAAALGIGIVVLVSWDSYDSPGWPYAVTAALLVAFGVGVGAASRR